MTAQEAYDRIRAYFSQPGAQLAKTPNTNGRTCWYRINAVSYSTGCAVGCLIPDELYDPHLDDLDDGTSIGDVVMAANEGDEVCEKIVNYLGIHEDDDLFNFLQDAQLAHDCSSTIETFFKSLDKYAQDAGLTVASS